MTKTEIKQVRIKCDFESLQDLKVMSVICSVNRELKNPVRGELKVKVVAANTLDLLPATQFVSSDY